MQDFLELTVSAAASGCIYGLIALAYLLMIRPTGIINFAVGEWAMVGAFGGYLLLSKFEWPYPLGMAAVLVFMLVIARWWREARRFSLPFWPCWECWSCSGRPSR